MIFLINETDRFTTVLYQYGSLYRVVMLTPIGDHQNKMELPACYREFKTLEEAKETYNNWILKDESLLFS